MSALADDSFELTVVHSSDLDDFRASALRFVLFALPTITLAIVGAFALNYDGTPIQLAVLIPLPLMVTAIGFALLNRQLPIATLFTMAGLLVLLSVAAWMRPGGLLPALYCVVVLIAGTAGGPRASWATGAATAVLILAGWLVNPQVIRTDVALLAAVLVGAAALFSWLATSPIYVALGWAWQSYERARRVSDELRDRQGELSRVVKSLNEAYSQLERLNDELARARLAAEEARRLKAQFAANISHELRTPLNLIIGFSEMMATAPEAYGGRRLAEAYRSDLAAILRNARHLSGLIDDVLDLSQIDAGRMGLVKEPTSIAEVIGEAIGAVARLFEGRGLTLRAEIPEDVPSLFVDRTRIRQVLINLLGNAARFTDQGGVVVRAALDGSDVQVTVQDTGIGIAAADIPKMFEEFRQLDGSLRRRAGGTGLGLAISKQFVELHGGAMWAESEPGKGTSFHFTLPIRGNVIATVPDGDWRRWDRLLASRAAEMAEVRLATSDPALARIFQRYLDGYRVTAYPSVAAAIAKPGRAACCVTAGSPEEAWQALATQVPGSSAIPIIACTLPISRQDLKDVGVAACLAKPVSREQVLSALQSIDVPWRNVLIVDDEAEMLRLLGRFVRFARRGSHVWLAEGGDEALAILRSRRPDVILLDFVMPGVDGWAVLAKLRSDERLRDVPVVAITAHHEAETVSAGLVGISRGGGLSVGDLMRCLRASLDALLDEGRAGDPAPAAGLAARSA